LQSKALKSEKAPNKICNTSHGGVGGSKKTAKKCHVLFESSLTTSFLLTKGGVVLRNNLRKKSKQC